jgi:hypothetical protein
VIVLLQNTLSADLLLLLFGISFLPHLLHDDRQ